jgi:hypothetical protein
MRRTTGDLSRIPGTMERRNLGVDDSAATRFLCLNRRAFHRAVRTKDAAVTGPWSQQRLTALARVEELAGIRRHGFMLRMSAQRARQHGVKKHSAHRSRAEAFAATAGLRCVWVVEAQPLAKAF